MQPLMNMITFTQRNRERIVDLHASIADSIESSDGLAVSEALCHLESYTKELAQAFITNRANQLNTNPS